MFLLCQQEDKIGANKSRRSRPCHQRPRGLQTPMLRRQEESKSRGVGGYVFIYLEYKKMKIERERNVWMGIDVLSRWLRYNPVAPLPANQWSSLIYRICMLFFFSFFNSFPWILCVLCFFPFQRVPIPPMDVTQDPPPVILRGAKTEEETAKTLCNQQQFHWR